MALVVGLFIFGLISFSYNYSAQNNANITILNQSSVNKMFGDISVKLNESSNEADAQRSNLVSETRNPVVTTLGFAFNSILSAGTTFMSSVIAMFQYIFIFAKETFMISPIVIGVITAIVIGMLVLAFWSLVRAGR